MCTNFQIVQIQTVISSSLQHLPITRAYGLHFLCLDTLELLIKTHRTEIHCPLTYFSMTTLLMHTVAHSTKPFLMPKTHNQPPKKFLSLTLTLSFYQIEPPKNGHSPILPSSIARNS